MEINSDIHYYDSAKRKSKKSISNKISILVSALVFSVVVMFFLISPEFERMKLIELEREVINDNLKLKNDIISRVAKFNKTNKDLDDDDLKKIYNLLPDNSSVNRQIASISKFVISDGNGILIKDFSMDEVRSSSLRNKPKSGEDVPDFEKVRLNFSFEGSFEEFVSFFGSIEKNIPLVDVENINITREKIRDEERKEESEEEGEEENERKNVLNCEVVFLLYHL